MKDLAKKLKKLLKNENVVDVIVFGSIAKGSLNYNDIDIAVIIQGEVSSREIRNQLSDINHKIDLQILTVKDYDKMLWVTLIREGYSVKHDDFLHNIMKIEPVVLFKYSLKSLRPSKKVMFERAIKNFKGITKLSNRVVLVPIVVSQKFLELLKLWNIDIDSQEYGLLPFVRKEEI